jgi:hypothetical protein
MEYDLDEAWENIKDDMDGWKIALSNDLMLLGEKAAAEEIHDKVVAFVQAYEAANQIILQYQQYTREHSTEIQAKRREQQHAAAEEFAAKRPVIDDTDDADDDESED